MPKTPTEDSPVLDARDLSIETIGRMAEFWGFTRTMGRVWGALYMSPAPMAQSDLVETLGVSTANVSMSLAGLLRWSAVHKVYEKGSRKIHYEAEPELRTIIRNVLGGREKRELNEATEALTDAVAMVKEATRGRKLGEDEAYIKDRIEHLQTAMRISDTLLELLLGEGVVNLREQLGED